MTDNTFYATSSILGVKFDTPTTSPEFQLGERVTATDGSVWVYVQASGAIDLKDFVGIDETFQAAALTKGIADDGYTIGVAPVVAFANDEYGFVCIAGSGSSLEGNVKANCAADVALYTSGTAGHLDDESSGQTKIDGVVATEAAGGADAAVNVIMTWPRSTTF